MCGIVGAAGPDASTLTLNAALELLRHRGPDASGVRRFAECTLGHTRLRIMDLSELADQPIANEDGTVWAVYNGEIYNFLELRDELKQRGHRFRSAGDTEVLVHLYEEHGSAMVDRLRGMFAFALWDDRAKRLLLARDRLGIKPLYYSESGGGVAFASEVRALGHYSDGLDRHSLEGYLRLGWISGPDTILDGISELSPGHVLHWDSTGTRVERWWEPPTRRTAVGSADDLHAVLRDAVTRHLVSDVPVGLFLSSGLDSVAIAHLAADIGADVRAYTVGFDGADESEDASRVAAQLRVAHEVVRVEGEEVLSRLPDIIGAMDQPTVDGVNTWAVSRAVRSAGCSVALSGLGGDEVFAGYSTFRRVPKLVRGARVTRRMPYRARRLATQVAGRFAGPTGRRAVEAMADGGWSSGYAAMRGVTSHAELRALWPDAVGSGLVGVDVVDGIDDLDTVTQLELRNYLPNQLLRDTDAMSMSHSLEVRVPLLDDDVVATALATPIDEQGHSGKRRLAAAVDARTLELAGRRKKTFTLPFDAWLRGPLAATAGDAVARLGEPDVGLDRRALATMWRRWEAGQVSWRTVWALAVLGMWTDTHRPVAAA